MERVIIELFDAAENGFDPSIEPKPGFQFTGDDSSKWMKNFKFEHYQNWSDLFITSWIPSPGNLLETEQLNIFQTKSILNEYEMTKKERMETELSIRYFYHVLQRWNRTLRRVLTCQIAFR